MFLTPPFACRGLLGDSSSEEDNEEDVGADAASDDVSHS